MRQYNDFWDMNHSNRLCGLTIAIQSTHRKDAEKLKDFIAQNFNVPEQISASDCIAEVASYSAFIDGELDAISSSQKTALLISMREMLKLIEDKDQSTQYRFLDLDFLFKEMLEVSASREFGLSPPAEKETVAPAPEDGAPLWTRDDVSADFVRKVLKMFFLSADNGERSKKLLFEKGDPPTKHFDTFRFSSKVGHIQKSLTVVHEPEPGLIIPRFSNYFDHNGAVRRSHGVVLNFAKHLVFLGTTQLGASIKLMVVDSPPGAMNEYKGLVITNEPSSSTVAARFMMRRTKTSNHKDTHTGTLGPKEIKKLPNHEELLDKIRNTVKFNLEYPIFDADEEEVSETQMVSLVEGLIQGKHLSLKDKDGLIFNPASDRRYTYNSALNIQED